MKPAADTRCQKCGRGPAYREGCSIVDCPHRGAWVFDPEPHQELVRVPVEPTIRDLFDPYYEEDDR